MCNVRWKYFRQRRTPVEPAVEAEVSPKSRATCAIKMGPRHHGQPNPLVNIKSVIQNAGAYHPENISKPIGFPLLQRRLGTTQKFTASMISDLSSRHRVPLHFSGLNRSSITGPLTFASSTFCISFRYRRGTGRCVAFFGSRRFFCGVSAYESPSNITPAVMTLRAVRHSAFRSCSFSAEYSASRAIRLRSSKLRNDAALSCTKAFSDRARHANGASR